jgi:hypothetical protein
VIVNARIANPTHNFASDLLADRLIDVRYLCFDFRYRNRRIDATYDFALG